MHQHIIMNHDIGLYLVIVTDEPEINLVDVLDEMILKELTCYA